MALLLNVSLYLCDQGYLCDSQASVTFFFFLTHAVPSQKLCNCCIQLFLNPFTCGVPKGGVVLVRMQLRKSLEISPVALLGHASKDIISPCPFQETCIFFKHFFFF